VKKRLIVLVALACVIGAVVASTASSALKDGGGLCRAYHSGLVFCGD
jgi:hypothetical protein